MTGPWPSIDSVYFCPLHSGLSPLPGETSSYLSLPGESTEDNLILPNLMPLNNTIPVDIFNLPTHDNSIMPSGSSTPSNGDKYFFHPDQVKPAHFIMTCNSALSRPLSRNGSQGNISYFPLDQAMQVKSKHDIMFFKTCLYVI